jgi:hypothetical protein
MLQVDQTHSCLLACGHHTKTWYVETGGDAMRSRTDREGTSNTSETARAIQAVNRLGIVPFQRA